MGRGESKWMGQEGGRRAGGRDGSGPKAYF